jgi:dTDP-D-glucose 4,6-dehydratase
MLRNVLVTGGAGFIGSHFVARLINNSTIETVTVLDALTYAGHRENLAPVADSPKLVFVEGNILDGDLLASVGAATETDPVRPTFPYSASKAASDLATLAHFQSFGTPVSVTRSESPPLPATGPPTPWTSPGTAPTSPG